MNGTAPFRLHGTPIPRSSARNAPDGTKVFETATGLPVTRYRHLQPPPENLDWLPWAWPQDGAA